MKRKDIGLLVSICVLAFLAVFSEKKVQVGEGYYLTTSELKVGGEVFRRVCRRCHGRGTRSGAPSVSNVESWKRRLRLGMETLIEHALHCPGGKGRMPARGGDPSLTREEAEAAIGYMIRRSRDAVSDWK